MTKMGRPPKPDDEREDPITIRMSQKLVNSLKVNAAKHDMPWQTYMKKIVKAHLQKRSMK